MTSTLYKLPLWCIVQTDSDKTRATILGPVPIQCFGTVGGPPLVQRIIHRALSIAGPRQIIATVAVVHRKFWSNLMWCVPPQRRVVHESTRRQTATLAVALAVIERTAQEALPVLQPTDTSCVNERGFIAGVRRAVSALDELPGHVVTLTVNAYASEPGQDYLLLGNPDGLPRRSVLRFVKRPPCLLGEPLVEMGASLSTELDVGRLSTLSGVLGELWPDLLADA